ncbi:hypothetical protein [Prauserella cavernicola]|uniref:Lipoprotein n=1 Tax=Prauserella cavernicola TaxID=2800127 RepID=A0A934V5U6_9PSEU|nr:hypothetical protein [Prauserella cavernicola]MBK1784993.1 hypothetical protein [Prauserella cavernicola]
MLFIKAATGAVAVSVLGVALTGCGGSSVEGTYFGTAGDTILVIKSEGECLYSQEYKEGQEIEDLDERDIRECTWTVSGDHLTFSGLVKRGGTVQGTVSDDGSLSLPHQKTWNGEIYTKG